MRSASADAEAPPFRNAYLQPEDHGRRVSPAYFFKRAWGELSRDRSATRTPPVVALDVEAMAHHGFAVSWLGHASLLVRAGSKWVLLDPIWSTTAGPLPGIGPNRLTPLPISVERLPHIDVVLISHDHYDHLDAPTLRRLVRQPGGPPRFFVGRGLGGWVADHVDASAEEFEWWESVAVGELTVTFVPAQHNSGRSLWNRNTTLWGGWVLRHDDRRFYFPGDTSYAQRLFEDVKSRAGPIDLAALPIGAYEPRELMRFDHMNPADALQAHADLQATRSFAVHWGTFQLGDEAPYQAALDFAAAASNTGPGFRLAAIGEVIEVPGGSGDDRIRSTLR